MKLGKIQRLLTTILVLGLMGSNIAAQVTTSSVETAITANSNGQVISKNNSAAMPDVDGRISDDEKIAYLQKNGEAVGASVEKDNIKITLENILTDGYTCQMLLSVETIDGTPFKGDEYSVNLKRVEVVDKRRMEIEEKKRKLIEALPENAERIEHLKIEAQFDEQLKETLEKYTRADGTFDEEGFNNDAGRFGREMSSGSGYGLCDTAKNTANKKYFIYEGDNAEATGNELLVQIGGVTQSEEKEYDITKTVVDYLKQHSESQLETMPLEITEEEKKELEESKTVDKEWYESYKAELEARPKEILKKGKLDLSVVPDDDFYINNMGFINNQFHMCFNGTTNQRYRLRVIGKGNAWTHDIYSDYRGSSKDEEEKQVEMYKAYDIKDNNALNDYTFKLCTNKVLEETKEFPEIALTVKTFAEPKVLTVNKELTYKDDKKIVLKEIRLNEYSLYLRFGKVEEIQDIGNVQVKLKDGTIKNLDSRAIYGRDPEATYVYILENIQREDIMSILYKGQEILL